MRTLLEHRFKEQLERVKLGRWGIEYEGGEQARCRVLESSREKRPFKGKFGSGIMGSPSFSDAILVSRRSKVIASARLGVRGNLLLDLDNPLPNDALRSLSSKVL